MRASVLQVLPCQPVRQRFASYRSEYRVYVLVTVQTTSSSPAENRPTVLSPAARNLAGRSRGDSVEAGEAGRARPIAGSTRVVDRRIGRRRFESRDGNLLERRRQQ